MGRKKYNESLPSGIQPTGCRKTVRMAPQQAQTMLREQGMEVTLEEADQILDFIYPLAEIAVAQALRESADDQKMPGPMG